MQEIAQALHTKDPEHLKSFSVNTTLYEVIEVISKEIDPVEDGLIPAIVTDLLDRGLIMLPDSMEKPVTDFSVN